MANAVDDRTYGIHVDHVRRRQRRRLPDRREHGSSCGSIPAVSTDDRVAAAPGFTGVHAGSARAWRHLRLVSAARGGLWCGLRSNEQGHLHVPGRSGMTKHSTKRGERTGPLWWVTSIVSWTLLLAISAVIV